MAVVATEPLTRDEPWVKAKPGTLWVFANGDLMRTFEPPAGYMEAHPPVVSLC
jgi:glutamine amidotransferase